MSSPTILFLNAMPNNYILRFRMMSNNKAMDSPLHQGVVFDSNTSCTFMQYLDGEKVFEIVVRVQGRRRI